MSCALRVNAATTAISPCPPLGVGSKTGLVMRRPSAFCCEVAARCWLLVVWSLRGMFVCGVVRQAAPSFDAGAALLPPPLQGASALAGADRSSGSPQCGAKPLPHPPVLCGRGFATTALVCLPPPGLPSPCRAHLALAGARSFRRRTACRAKPLLHPRGAPQLRVLSGVVAPAVCYRS